MSQRYEVRHGNVDPPRWWNTLYFSDKTWAGGVVFNFQSDPVRSFLIDNTRFYLDEYRVDGFRFDEVSVIDRESYGRGWDFCQALTTTLLAHRPGALLHAEYWNVNPWIVREPSDDNGAGFHTTMTDGARIAVRELLAAAGVPGDHPLPLTRVADQLGLEYLRDRWRGVNSFENHDLVMQPKDAQDTNRMPRLARVADPANPRSPHAQFLPPCPIMRAATTRRPCCSRSSHSSRPRSRSSCSCGRCSFAGRPGWAKG